MRNNQQGWMALSSVLVLWSILFSVHVMLTRQVMLEKKVFTLAQQAVEAEIAAESGLQAAFYAVRYGKELDRDAQTEILTLSKYSQRIKSRGCSHDKKVCIKQSFDVIWQAFLRDFPPQAIWEYREYTPWLPLPKPFLLQAVSAGFSHHNNCQQLATSRLLVVTGNCTLRQNLGSSQAPVLLWIIEGNLTIQSGVKVFAVLGFFSHVPQHLTLEHNAFVHGAVLSTAALKTTAAQNVVFDKDVVRGVKHLGQWFRVSGSWQQETL